MRFDLRVQLFVAVLVLPGSVLAANAVLDSPADRLASVESFSSISDTAARSAAIFTELGKVLTNPRCLNCHPAGDRPHQGDTSRLHQPPVERGVDGFGLPALRCPICHQSANFDPAGVPGNPVWHLPRVKWDGRARRSARFVPRSRIPRAMEAGLSTRSLTISARTIWSVGLGRLDTGGNRLPARRRKRARSSRHG
jgi:hypothetical protein